MLRPCSQGWHPPLAEPYSTCALRRLNSCCKHGTPLRAQARASSGTELQPRHVQAPSKGSAPTQVSTGYS